MPQSPFQMQMGQPFAQNRDPSKYGDPISTAVGSFAESFMDELTFGIYDPDIVPESQEQVDPVAATIGRISGSIAGFIPSIAVSGLAGIKMLNAFKWGKKITTGVNLTKFMAARKGLVQTGTQFVIHDVAREFVNQMKTNDIDSYNIGHAAVKGLVGGGIFGLVGGYMHYAHPLQRIAADGGAMMAADAVNLAFDGEDPLDHKNELIQSFVLGAALAAPSFRNWRGKRMEYDAFQAKIAGDVSKAFSSPDNEVGAEVYKVTRKHGIADMPEIKKLMQEYKTTKMPTNMKTLKKTAKINIDRFKWGEDMNAPVSKGHRGMLQKVRRDLEIDEDAFHDMIGMATKGRTRTSKEITVGEAKETLKDLITYAQGYIDDANATGEVVKTVRKQFGFKEEMMEEYAALSGTMRFTPMDTRLEKLGLADYLSDPTRARRYMDVEIDATGREIRHLIDMFETASKTGLKEAITTSITNRPTAALLQLETALQTSNFGEMKEIMRGFSKEQRYAFHELRKVTNFYLNRVNETRRFLGLEEIRDRKGYLRKVMMATEEAEVGMTYEQAKGIEINPPTKVKEKINPTALPRKENAGGKEVYTGKDRIYRRMMNMVNHDAKEIYLHSPGRIVNAHVNAMSKAGIISNAEVKTIVDYMEHFVFAEPIESIKQNNIHLKQFLKDYNISPMFNALMSKLNINREIGERPASQLASLFGRGVSQGMISGRPSIAFRNLFQAFLPHSFVSTKSLAKSLYYKIPDELQRHLDKSEIFLRSLTLSEEGIGGRGLMGITQKTTVESAAKAGYFEMESNILTDVSGKRGYSTKAGRELRAESKAKVFSEDEWTTRIMPEIEHMIGGTQWMYDIMGMPGTYNTLSGKLLFKLQSWPMNYAFKYLDENVYRFKNGYRSWDKNKEMPLTTTEKYGIVKHFVGMTLIVNAMAQLGMDYTSIAGITPTPDKDKLFGVKWNVGALNMRPSPGMALITGMQKLLSDDEYEREEGIRSVKWIMAPVTIPGYLAGREIIKAIETGEPSGLLFKMKTQPGRRKSTVHGVSFKPFSIPKVKPFGSGSL